MITQIAGTTVFWVLFGPSASAVRVVDRLRRRDAPERMETLVGWLNCMRRGALAGLFVGVAAFLYWVFATGVDPLALLEPFAVWPVLVAAYIGAHLGLWCSFWPFVGRSAATREMTG
jgi:hypothetical protein